MFTKKGGFSFNYHYLLSISLFLFITGTGIVKKKITCTHCLLTMAVLLTLSLAIYGKRPSHGFGMTKNWNYLYEKKVHEIIRRENITNYNIVNLGYDTVATVQKYLLKKENISLAYDDYYHNKYLFVISATAHFMNNPAYEINTFTPSRRLKKWNINETYALYLLERMKQDKRCANKSTLLKERRIVANGCERTIMRASMRGTGQL